MAEIAAQIWKSTGLSIERLDDEESRAVTFTMSGPLTARDMYCTLSPDAFYRLMESPLDSGEPRIQHINLSQVPYMDSSGLGMLVTHYVRCRNKGIQVTVTDVSPRVLELFRLSKVEALFQPYSAA